MHKIRRFLLIALIPWSVGILRADPPARPGWQKIAVKYLFTQPNASAAAQLAQRATIDDVEEYDTFFVASIPAGSFEAVRRAAHDLRLNAVLHDEYDIIETYSASVDTRRHLDVPDLGRPSADYAPSEFGLYLVQFKAPPKPDWIRAVEQLGGVLIRGVPVNGQLIGATPDIASRLRATRFVQWIEPLHPYLKAWPNNTPDSPTTSCIVEVARIPGSSGARDRARSLAMSGTDRSDFYSAPGLFVVGDFTAEGIERVLREPSVIGIYAVPAVTGSDERQAMSITTNVATVSNNDIPTNPGTYSSWLYDTTRCNVCSHLATDGFKVDIADTGFYDGAQFPPDISSSRFVWGTNFFLGTDSGTWTWYGAPPGQTTVTRTCPDVSQRCDVSGHGTSLSSIVAGDGGGTGQRDSGNFVMGNGIAPSAGIVLTKQSGGANQSQVTTSTIFDWAADAVSHGAFTQNISQNAAFNTGAYTSLSVAYDKVVRGVGSSGYATTPVTLTISSGNVASDGFRTRAPATAKNVLSVGAAEGVRDIAERRQGGPWGPLTSTPRADTFRNIWQFTCHGTNVQSTPGTPWDTYIKPDLVAPATQVSTVMTPLMLLPAVPVTDCLATAETFFDCDFQKRYGFYVPNSNPLRYSQNYIIRSGTSFAAPVGAGAALIASRVFSGTPGAATPALIKAMLTATARSLNGGLNYAVNGDTTPNVVPQTIGPAPNDVQGFGRIDISDIVDSAIPKSYVNQEPQTILGQGDVWVKSYVVSRDGLPVKIAMSWSDSPSSDVSQNPVTLLTNNLDLEVRRENGVTCSSYLGNNIGVTEESITYDCASGFTDGKNNIEKVVFSAPSGTIFTVIVGASALLQRAIPCVSEPCSTIPAQDFALYVQNATEVASLPAPTLISAMGGASSVTVSWTTIEGAAKYQLYRGIGAGAMQQIAICPGDAACSSASSYSDSGLQTGIYKYAVAAVNTGGGAMSSQSNSDFAWVGAFTDDPLIAGATAVKANHVLELRNLVNQLRGIAGLSAFGFSTNVAPLEFVRATDIGELRTALDQARQTLFLSQLTYANVVAPGQPVRAVDIREIRDGLR